MSLNIINFLSLKEIFTAASSLIKFEFKKNRFSFLIPGLFFVITVIYLLVTGTKLISPNPVGTWLILGAAVVLAMVYGLQCFSSEADKHTLDFILTRPLSPYLLLTIKYFLSLGILLLWSGLFGLVFKIDLSQLALPKEIHSEWLLLLLLLIHGTSCLSGLLAKRLERLVVVIGLIGFEVGASYLIWSKTLDLTKANFYWLDVPSYLFILIQTVIPIYLAAISLAIPVAVVIWYLRSRIRPWRFRPLQWLAGIWFITGLLLILAQHFLAPPLWPDERAIYGDWHQQGGLVLTGAKNRLVSAKSLSEKKISCYLKLARFGNKPHFNHFGFNIHNPRFSPNGQQLVFAENGRLKLLELKTMRLADLVAGGMATWSENGREIIYAQSIGANGLSQLYRFNLTTQQRQKLSDTQYNLADLAWDSRREQLYLIGYFNKLDCLNLRTKKLQEIQFPKTEHPRIAFGIVPPAVVLLPRQKRLFIGQVFQEELKIFKVNLQTNQLKLNESKNDFRIKQLPLLIKNDGTALIWSRIDGTFVYQASYYLIQKEHSSRDHRGHHHF